jgi:GntR family transcriptional regulator, histidine utilization repressor
VKGWEDVRAEVQLRIRRGEWPLGSMIPHEEQLAQTFGVARATVNRALRELAAQGVLERKRKGGTRVLAVPVRKATLDIPIIRAEVEAMGAIYSHRILARRMGEATMPPALRREDDDPALLLETLFLADALPYVYERRLLNTNLLPDLPDFEAISANEWLVTAVSYATGDISFSAANANPIEAKHLQVEIGAALFITDRITRDAVGRVITQVRLAHAPGYRRRTKM